MRAHGIRLWKHSKNPHNPLNWNTFLINESLFTIPQRLLYNIQLFCILSCSVQHWLFLTFKPPLSLFAVLSPNNLLHLPPPCSLSPVFLHSSFQGHIHQVIMALNLKFIQYIQTSPKHKCSNTCTLTWPRACVGWSQAWINWWSFLSCSLCASLIKLQRHTNTCLAKEVHICHFPYTVHQRWSVPPRQAHKAQWQLDGWAEGVRDVAYDSNTEALVFSEVGCIIH